MTIISFVKQLQFVPKIHISNVEKDVTIKEENRFKCRRWGVFVLVKAKEGPLKRIIFQQINEKSKKYCSFLGLVDWAC